MLKLQCAKIEVVLKDCICSFHLFKFNLKDTTCLGSRLYHEHRYGIWETSREDIERGPWITQSNGHSRESLPLFHTDDHDN